MDNREDSQLFQLKKDQGSSDGTQHQKKSRKCRICAIVSIFILVLVVLIGFILYVLVFDTNLDKTEDRPLLPEVDLEVILPQNSENPQEKPGRSRKKSRKKDIENFKKRMEGLYSLKAGYRAKPYYISLGVNTIMATMASNMKADITVKVMEDGFDLLMSTTFKSVTQKFYFAEFGKNATIENPMTGGTEEVECVASKKSWTCTHHHKEKEGLLETVEYSLKNDDELLVIKRESKLKEVYDFGEMENSLANARWEYKRQSTAT